jgi:putative NADH-flavin reductase
MNVTVFGGATPTGRAVGRAALDAGHAVTVLVPDEEPPPIDDDRLRVVEGDVFDVPSVEEAVRGADAVVTAFDTALDTLPGADNADAMANVLDALERYQANRLVVVTGVTEHAGGLRGRVSDLFSSPPDAKLDEQERMVAATDLAWTVARPAGLTDGDPTGTYRMGASPDGAEPVPRVDLAAAVLDLIERDEHVRERVAVSG